ncbi:NADP-dependent oxidoreductase [Acidisoma cellulosilytica]|uniref:NADP-dependent oxidoreductase n=1 Tax=Acidisoma cellulosilyticum TaxID=2802395 RepID=A0A964E344_9PROT|nr:NADP-dependent oxidoreductase [Acidisoma cellulosilyticum]MCB8880305.1 NADP-dependent oxidoreductase [Acidisoma cellulosilyticum]
MSNLRRSIILASRPKGAPSADNFALDESVMPKPAEGEVLTRTLWLSLDPYMRGRMSDKPSYAPPVAIGAPMTGETVGEVVESRDPRFVPGDVVTGAFGWQSHIISAGDRLTTIPKGAPYSAYLGVLGMPGATAYAGMTEIGQVKPGETVVISAASGAVGAVAGQLAKRAGARVVGVAGNPDKCLYIQDTLGFDECIDHRAVMDLDAALRDACPNGIDVYFENVGGDLQDAVYPLMNNFGRMIMCGMVAEYNDTKTRPGPNLMDVVRKRLRIEGFIVMDKPERFVDWRALAAPWVADGSLHFREHVVDGLENAPEAFIDLLRGHNFGKLVIRVAEPSKGA